MAIWLYGPQVIACYISAFAELISHVVLFAATQYSGTWALPPSRRVGGIDTKNFMDLMGFYGILWDLMGFYGILWDFMGFYGILW